MAGQLRAPLVVLAPLTDGIASLRAPLVTLEPLAEGTPNLRAALVISEALSEGYRNLRASLVCIEALIPVLEPGQVSTELFPGSMGSSVALPGLAFDFHKRPRFATNKHKAASGVSVRNALMENPIWEFEASYSFLEDASGANSSLKLLMGFFMSRQGAFDTFLFKDKDDYQVIGGSLGTGDGATTQFPFLRNLGGFNELVGQVDVSAALNIYKNGVLQTLGSAYSISLPNQVVFTSAPAVGVAITADFQFFFNCAFQEDAADFAKFADKLWELQQITFETVPQ